MSRHLTQIRRLPTGTVELVVSPLTGDAERDDAGRWLLGHYPAGHPALERLIAATTTLRSNDDGGPVAVFIDSTHQVVFANEDPPQLLRFERTPPSLPGGGYRCMYFPTKPPEPKETTVSESHTAIRRDMLTACIANLQHAAPNRGWTLAQCQLSRDVDIFELNFHTQITKDSSLVTLDLREGTLLDAVNYAIREYQEEPRPEPRYFIPPAPAAEVALALVELEAALPGWWWSITYAGWWIDVSLGVEAEGLASKLLEADRNVFGDSFSFVTRGPRAGLGREALPAHIWHAMRALQRLIATWETTPQIRPVGEVWPVKLGE